MAKLHSIQHFKATAVFEMSQSHCVGGPGTVQILFVTPFFSSLFALTAFVGSLLFYIPLLIFQGKNLTSLSVLFSHRAPQP